MNEETLAGATYAMPTTPPQARLWHLEQLMGPDPSWNVAVRFRLSGQVDREKLEASLQLLTTRHESLRTSIALHGAAVVQLIVPRTTLPIEWCDLRALVGEAQAAEVTHLSLEHARQVLPLSNAPLFRVRVLRLTDDEHVMLWNTHLAVCDGWSIGLLSRDLMHCYGELSLGRVTAPRNSIEYGDYAVWLEGQRSAPAYQVHRRYWSDRLRGLNSPALPTSWRNQESLNDSPAIRSVLLPRELTDRLGAVAQAHEATFFHAALAVFAVLMRSDQALPEVCVGTPLSGRDQSELEDVVGTFVNYLPLRFRVDGETRFAHLLHSVRDLVTDALEHAQFRFEDILADLPGATTPAAENKLFSAAFICQQDFVHPLSAAGVALTAIPSVTTGAARPLTVFMVERPDGWRLSCEVDNRAVSAAAGSTILEKYQRLIAAVASDAEELVSQLAKCAEFDALAPICDAAIFEQHEPVQSPRIGMRAAIASPASIKLPATEAQLRFWLLDRLNPGDASFDLSMRLEMNGSLNIEALRSAAEKLIEQNEILRTTLEEIDGQVWQIIHSRGTLDFKFSKVESPSTDPSSFQEDEQKPFSLSAGSLFRVRVLQFEPERHWLIVTLSHAVADGWSSGIFLEQLRLSYEECLLGTRAQPHQPPAQFSAYAATERKLLASPEKDRRLAWWRERLQGTWLSLALPRDTEENTAGKKGANAAMASAMLAPSAVLSARNFARECSATLFAVFGAAFQALLARYSGQGDILFLTPFANRTSDTEAILGPLAIPVCLTGHVAPQATFRELVTELSTQSIDAMEHVLPFSLVAPLLDIRVVGGHHVLNQITFFHQRAFVHEMQWGTLEVKPLPEIHAATGSEWQLGMVERDEGVSIELLYDASLYSAQTMSLVERHYSRLLSSAVMEPDMPLSQLQFITQEEIASYSAGLPVLPITARLLPGGGNPRPNDDVKGPAEQQSEASTLSQSERDLKRIWQPLFKNDELTVDSNFFDLGGHSLLLARLQLAIKKEFDVQLSVADVFREPTLGALAAWLDRARSPEQLASPASQFNPRVIPIQPLGTGRPLFVISQSMIFRALAAELGTDQPVYALQILDEDITPAMASAGFEELTDFYIRLIREVQPSGPYRLAGWCVSGWIAYGIARQLELKGEEIELLMVMDAWAPGYWSKQPRMRRTLMRAIYRGERFLWVMRRLRPCSMSERQAYIRRSLHGMAAAAARNLTAWLHHMNLPVNIRLTEEMRRSEQLEYTASRAFEVGPLEGKVLLFRSEEQPTGPLLAPDMGWTELLGRPMRVDQLPGDHQEIFDHAGVKIMAALAREVLSAPPLTSTVEEAPRNSANPERHGHHSPLVEA